MINASESLKPATTYDEQIALLRNKRIIVNDEDVCRKFLSTSNYYRISGYILPYKAKDSDTCFRDTDFNRIMNIYKFDAELRTLIFSIIEKIETHLRTQLAYYHGHHYGPAGYLDASSFAANHQHSDFLDRVNKCISENEKTLVVKHHQAKYGGIFPIWVISDFFSIGMLSYFYLGMINTDKTNISTSLYGVNYQILESWLRCITDLRNRCAHYSRLYYWIFPAIPKMPDFIQFKTDRRLYTQIYMLKLMYPFPESWKDDFYNPLTQLITKYKKYISLKHIGFPDDWKTDLQ